MLKYLLVLLTLASCNNKKDTKQTQAVPQIAGPLPNGYVSGTIHIRTDNSKENIV